jgi:hypothetical protein
MEFHYDDYYRPSHDVVFSITFAKKDLFARLCSAVYGKRIIIVGDPHSQAVKWEDDVLLNTIRFDVLAVADTEQVFTIDIQRRYTKGRQERRGAYYICRAISSQPVYDMKYEELHPVHIAFILTNYTSAASGVRKVGLCYQDTGEPYDDLIELVLVYVPEIIKAAAADEADDLYIFSRFFAVSSEQEARDYASEFKTNQLAKELIRVHNSIVANKKELQAIENNPYYVQRLTEAQLTEVREEAEAKGEAKGRAEGEAIGMVMGEAIGEAKGRAEGEAKGRAEGINQLAELIKKGYDIDTALSMIAEDKPLTE